MSNEQPRLTKRKLIEAGLLTVIVCVAVIYATRLSSSLAFPDEREYYALATHLVHEHTFALTDGVPTASRPPGYSWVLTLPLILHDGVRTLRVFGLICWVLIAVIAASLARRLRGATAGALTALLILLYPVELYTAGTLFPQTFSALLFILLLWLHFAMEDLGDWFSTILEAVLWAWLVLTNPIFLASLVLLILYTVLIERKRTQPAIILMTVVLATYGWMERNQVVFHRSMIASNSGYNLAMGNSATAGANSGIANEPDPVWARSPQEEMFYINRDTQYGKTAKKWIGENPGDAAKLYLKKWINWFGYRLNLKTSNEGGHARELLIAVPYYGFCLLALLAPFFLKARLRLIATLFLLQYLAAATAYSVFFTRIRFRLPFDYLLILLAALSTTALLTRLRLVSEHRPGNEHYKS